MLLYYGIESITIEEKTITDIVNLDYINSHHSTKFKSSCTCFFQDHQTNIKYRLPDMNYYYNCWEKEGKQNITVNIKKGIFSTSYTIISFN